MKWIWLGLTVTLLLLERLDKRKIAIFFSCSAFISFLISLIFNIYLIEFLEFVIVGTILMITLREKVIEKYERKK